MEYKSNIQEDSNYIKLLEKNVGIGTTNPNVILEIGGLIQDVTKTVFRSSLAAAPTAYYNDITAIYSGASAQANKFIINYANGYTSGTGISLQGDGNVGIGTSSPAYKLDVNGNIRGTGTSQLNHLNCISTLSFGSFTAGVQGTLFEGYSTHSVVRTDSARLDFYMGKTTTGVGTMMSLTDTGKVGIGTTTPDYKLEVTGDVKVNTGALGVNVNPNATDGRIDASNDIVAFSSDKRLKTNVQLIENPIGKIKNLSGFTYNWNKKANELAKYDTKQSFVGVYAQEVQAVLPEAVKLAPFDNDGNDKSISGENYLTVQYEKIVPLLIEALKEQQKQIDELKIKIDGITS